MQRSYLPHEVLHLLARGFMRLGTLLLRLAQWLEEIDEPILRRLDEDEMDKREAEWVRRRLAEGEVDDNSPGHDGPIPF